MNKLKIVSPYIAWFALAISVCQNMYLYQELSSCKDFIRIVRPWIPYESYPEIKANIEKLKKI